MTANVVVIGAGVVGLSTAINIQRLVPSCSVTIVAEDVIDGTASVGAGAIFRPTAEYLPGVDIQKARQWIRNGWEHFSSLALSESSGPAGIAITPSFMLSRTEIKDPLYKDVVFTFHQLSGDEMKKMGFDKHFRFLQNGGKVEKRRVRSMKEFRGLCGIVVNCSATGSRQLFGDNTINPNRGQLLRGAEVDNVWVGLRPIRSPLRIEKEIIKIQDDQLTVVHNYGHCSDGIALSWGTAVEAAGMVRDCLKRSSKL